MNCSKCGSEMKFVGSISRGKMECPRCDAHDFMENLDKADSLAAPLPSHVQGAMQRMREYEDYTQHNKGTCPYCARLAGHFNDAACSFSYSSDETTVTVFQTGSQPKSAPSALVWVGMDLNVSGLKVLDQKVEYTSQVVFTTVLFFGYVVTIKRSFQEVMANRREGKVIKFHKDGVQP